MAFWGSGNAPEMQLAARGRLNVGSETFGGYPHPGRTRGMLWQWSAFLDGHRFGGVLQRPTSSSTLVRPVLGLRQRKA